MQLSVPEMWFIGHLSLLIKTTLNYSKVFYVHTAEPWELRVYHGS